MCEYPIRPVDLKDIDNSQPRSSMLEMVDHDMFLKIDEILSIQEQITEPVVTLSPFEDPELSSNINPHALCELQAYGDQQLPGPLTKERLLTEDTIYKLPKNFFQHFKQPSHKAYFDVFYDEFSCILLPVLPASGANSIRDIATLYSLRRDYLYFAILASGARMSYKKTLLDEDQTCYSTFMQKTCDLLNDFNIVKSIQGLTYDKSLVSNTLEPLLLTILFLTSDNASSMKQSWRGHLKGAKELLYKIFVENLFPHTDVLIFCKAWFTLFEYLAGLTAPYGGTLDEEFERQKLMFNPESMHELEVLKKFELSDEDGFSYLYGISYDLIPPLLKLSADIRVLLKGDVLVTPSEILGLISDFQVKRRTLGDGNIRDVFNNVYIDAAHITLLTNFLEVDKNQAVVQGFVRSILMSLERNLEKSFKPYELFFQQWPLLVAGLNSVRSEHKYSVEKLFRLLASMGSGSAKFALDKIKKVWNNELNIEEVDIVTY